ncbi:hypothetical protein ACHAXH_005262 [Discostella pseudostelligera]|jgi:SHAQKYF class myb-like DNA-binding protein
MNVGNEAADKVTATQPDIPPGDKSSENNDPPTHQNSGDSSAMNALAAAAEARSSPSSSTLAAVAPTDPTDNTTSAPTATTETAAAATATTIPQPPQELDVSSPSPPGGKLVESGQENTGRWSSEEHEKFLAGLQLYGREWRKVAALVKTRTVMQTRTHAQKYFLKMVKE